MTVSSEVNRAGPYLGNGSTTVFGFGFRILSASHLRVIITDEDDVETDLPYPSGYSVTGVGANAGGSITISPAPTAGSRITILRNVPMVQETDLENQGAYYAETVERQFDLVVMQNQQQSEELRRAVKVPAGDPDPDGALSSGLAMGILRLYASADNIDTVAGQADAIDTVASTIVQVQTVATEIAAVQTVAGSIGDVGTVADDIVNVRTVAGVSDDVSIVATNIDTLLGASGSLLSMVPAILNGDGTTTEFSIPAPSTTANVIVWVNKVRQTPGDDYEVDTSTLNFFTAPAAGAEIELLIVTAVSLEAVQDLYDEFVEGVTIQKRNVITTAGQRRYAVDAAGAALSLRAATSAVFGASPFGMLTLGVDYTIDDGALLLSFDPADGELFHVVGFPRASNSQAQVILEEFEGRVAADADRAEAAANVAAPFNSRSAAEAATIPPVLDFFDLADLRFRRDSTATAFQDATGAAFAPSGPVQYRHYARAAGSVADALSRALNVDGDRCVDLGTGTFILDGETVEALHPFTLRGNGPGKTTLICRNMTGRTGLNLSLSGSYNGGVSRLEGVSVILEGENGGTFFNTPVGAAARSFLAKYEVVNCRWHGPQMSGTAAVQFAWETTLRLGDGDHHIVTGCEYYGRYDPRFEPTPANAFGTFVSLGGVAGEGGLGYPIIDDCRVLYSGRAVNFLGGLVARPKFDKLTIHDSWEGVISELPLGTTHPEEISFVDCDINTQHRSVYIEAIGQVVAVATDVTRAPGKFDHALGWTGWYVGYGGSIRLTDVGARDLVPSTGTPYTTTHTGYDLGGDDIRVQGRVRTATNGRFAVGARLRSPGLAQVDLSVASSGIVTTAVSVEGTLNAIADVKIDLKSFGTVTNRVAMSGGYTRSVVNDLNAPIVVDASATSISAAGSETHTPGVSPEWRRLSFGTGAGPYTYTVTMSAVGARRGDEVEFTFSMGSTNPTFRILDSVGAVQFEYTGTGTVERLNVRGRYVGTNAAFWRIVSDGKNR